MNNKDYGILGKTTSHPDEYSANHLFAIPRAESREEFGLNSQLPFIGVDIWNAYELSWLNLKGKPHVAVATIEINASSKNLIESKSLKHYLNSFNMSKFSSKEIVAETIQKDLKKAVEGEVFVKISTDFSGKSLDQPPGICIDHLDITCVAYTPKPSYLITNNQEVAEIVYSNILRTNCPVTGQPDWATLIIDYSGKQIDHHGLLNYIVSYRKEAGFHENCVERIFIDTMNRCKPEKLSVYGNFTRRGGIDINPFRSSHSEKGRVFRLYRQ